MTKFKGLMLSRKNSQTEQTASHDLHEQDIQSSDQHRPINQSIWSRESSYAGHSSYSPDEEGMSIDVGVSKYFVQFFRSRSLVS